MGTKKKIKNSITVLGVWWTGNICTRWTRGTLTKKMKENCVCTHRAKLQHDNAIQQQKGIKKKKKLAWRKSGVSPVQSEQRAGVAGRGVIEGFSRPKHSNRQALQRCVGICKRQHKHALKKRYSKMEHAKKEKASPLLHTPTGRLNASYITLLLNF